MIGLLLQIHGEGWEGFFLNVYAPSLTHKGLPV